MLQARAGYSGEEFSIPTDTFRVLFKRQVSPVSRTFKKFFFFFFAPHFTRFGVKIFNAIMVSELSYCHTLRALLRSCTAISPNFYKQDLLLERNPTIGAKAVLLFPLSVYYCLLKFTWTFSDIDVKPNYRLPLGW